MISQPPAMNAARISMILFFFKFEKKELKPDSSVCGCFSGICEGVFPSPSGIPDTPFVLRNLKLQPVPEL